MIFTTNAGMSGCAPTRRGVSEDMDAGKSLDDMDRGGVQTAMLSMSPPGLWFGRGKDVERENAVA